MASSSSIEISPTESSPEEHRNWVELPRDVTASILTRVGAIEILTSAQMVCKSWLEICKDPLMWRTIDMWNNDDPDYYDFDLDKICRAAVDRSCGGVVDISIEDSTDDLLHYITDRSSQIKRLGLACCGGVSDKGLIKAIEKLPLLEEIDLTHCSFSVEPLKALGRCCPRLKSLKLNGQANTFAHLDPVKEAELNKEVTAIVESLPELRRLQLIGNSMTDMGLEAILDGCPNLETLDLRRCININLKGNLGKRCAEHIKDLRIPSDPIKDFGFFADLEDEDDPFNFAGADFLFDYLGLGNEIGVSDEFDYYGYSSGNDSFDYDDFTTLNYNDF